MKRPDLHVSMSPHIHSGKSVTRMMLDSIGALIPAILFGWFLFGWAAIQVIAFAAASAIVTEFLWQKIMRIPVSIGDCSALYSGVLIGLVLPASVPWWTPVVGAFVAIIIGKQVFGGLGNHPFNAALVGWAFLQVSYKEILEQAPIPEPQFLMGSSEYLADSPLFSLKDGGVGSIEYVPWMDFVWGNVPGTIGTVSVLAVLVGGAYLLYRRNISWHIPLSFIFSAWIFAFIFWKIDPEVYANPTFHIVSGWMLLGAFFLAPEKGTSPVNTTAMIIYGAGCGILTMIIRMWGVYTEGVPFAILLMNALTPLLDRIRPKTLGRLTEIA